MGHWSPNKLGYYLFVPLSGVVAETENNKDKVSWQYTAHLRDSGDRPSLLPGRPSHKADCSHIGQITLLLPSLDSQVLTLLNIPKSPPAQLRTGSSPPGSQLQRPECKLKYWGLCEGWGGGCRPGGGGGSAALATVLNWILAVHRVLIL